VITSPTNGSTVTTGTPTISGTGTPGDTVTVSEGTTPICVAIVQPNGHWSCTPNAPLGNGTHTITAVQTGADGTSAPSAAIRFTVLVATVVPAGSGGSVPVPVLTNGGTLAYTGSEPVTPGLVAAAVMLALGVAGTFFGRRTFRGLKGGLGEE
jgi:hypothetical protein